MSSEALELLQLEIQEHRDTLAPQLEGFHDLASVDLQPESKAQALMDIQAGARREALSEAARFALQALREDGYPDLPIIKVPDAIYRDLADQKRTIDAALARYEALPPEAVGGNVTVGDAP